MKIIQIVGTNGKGSTAAMIAHTLIKNQYKTGLFTSPHLVTVHERIRINNSPIPNTYINKFILRHKDVIQKIQASFFEILTVMAIAYFKENNTDIIILETGLGGKYDSVTATKAQIIVFTSISLDHMHILGENISKITQEKAGAISEHTKLIISDNQTTKVSKVLNKQAKEHNLQILYTSTKINKKLTPKLLPGKHQQQNARLAYTALKYIVDIYQMKINNVIFLISHTFWPGRIQHISNKPKIIFDVGHNTDSLKVFINYFKSIYLKYKKRYLVVGFEASKDIKDQLKFLYIYFDYITITETQIRKSMEISQLLTHSIEQLPKIETNKNPQKAISQYKEILNSEDILVVLGSHYFGPYINKIFKNCLVHDNKNT